MGVRYEVKEEKGKYQVRQIDDKYDHLYSEWDSKELADYECTRLQKMYDSYEAGERVELLPYIREWNGAKDKGFSEVGAKIEISKIKKVFPEYNWEVVKYYVNDRRSIKPVEKFKLKGTLKNKEF
jgi:hypothetical protein